MELTHAIMLTCQTQGEDRQGIGWPPTGILACYLHKLVTGQPQLTPVGPKQGVRPQPFEPI
jgi:hypothetical protein